MRKEEFDALSEIAFRKPWEASKFLKKFLPTVVIDEKPDKVPLRRTKSQNKALHVNYEILANKLNDAGLDMKKVIKIDISWTPESVKKYLWKPIMKSLTGKTSTKDLKIEKEIDAVHKLLMRELGSKFGIEYHDFPSITSKAEEYGTTQDNK